MNDDFNEFKEAIKLARAVLDDPGRDQDSDISILARQFLRSLEREETGRKLLARWMAVTT